MPEAFDLDDTPAPDPHVATPIAPVPPPLPPVPGPPTTSGVTTDRPAPTQARPPAGQTQQAPNTKTTGVPPSAGNRASDLLRGHPNYKPSVEKDVAPKTLILTQDRRTTRIDDFATGLFWVSLVVSAGCLIYYLFGIFSGALSHEQLKGVANSAIQQDFANVNSANTVMICSGLLATGLLVFLFYDEAFAAYSLVGAAVFLQLILPIIIQQFYDISKMHPSDVSDHVITVTKQTAIIPAVPGFILFALEVVRQFVSKLETAKYAKANLKYGQNMTFKQPKIRNQFLGPCWNMPYCRDTIRSKCPVFLGKKGPCWRNKRGCMCDETIVLNATAGNWKDQVTTTLSMVEGKKGATIAPATQAIPQQQQLSMAFKKERCRQCVIFNTHQEQKYKALVGVTFVGTAALLVVFSSTLLAFVIGAYNWLDTVLAKMSFNGAASPTSNTVSQSVQLADPVAWVLLALVTIVVLSKFLQLVEYCCFKIKI